MYEGKEFQNTAKKLYYPGEVIFSNITVKNISFCDQISGKTTNQLLVRPIQIYEFPYSNLSSVKFQKSQKNETIFNIASDALYLYKPNQFIKGIKNLNLISNILTFKTNKLVSNNLNIELSNNSKKTSVDFKIIEKLCLNNYITNLNIKIFNLVFLFKRINF